MEFKLRVWRAEDAADMARYADNLKIAQNLRDVFPHPYRLEDAAEFIESCMSGDESQQLCRAIVVDGHAAGSIGVFRGSDVYRRSAELGYWLAEEYWGRGIVTGAVRQLCREAFERWDIVRIFAEPFAENLGSRRVLEKAGFVLEGVMRQGVVKCEQLGDYCMYALTKADF